MSKKAYSETEREQIKQKLLTVGLELLSQNGLQNTRLIDIIEAVGISKPFFYTFYTSLAELVIRIIDYQQELLYHAIQQEMVRQDISLQEKIYNFLYKVIYSSQHHFFIMTQEEEMWVYRRLNHADFEAFQRGQVQFYERVLTYWNLSEKKCSPKELGNLVLSIVLIHNSAVHSLPFFFPEALEKTANSQAVALSKYLASLTEPDD